MHPTGYGNALVVLDIAGCKSVKGRISDLAKLAGLRHLDLTGCRHIGGDVLYMVLIMFFTKRSLW